MMNHESYQRAAATRRRLVWLGVFLTVFVIACWILWPEGDAGSAGTEKPEEVEESARSHPATASDEPGAVPKLSGTNDREPDKPVEPKAGEDEAVIECRLRFMDLSRNPVPGVTVTLAPASRPEETTEYVTDSEGAIRLLAEKQVEHIVSLEGWCFSDLRKRIVSHSWWPAPDTPFLLRKDNLIHFEVAYADGAPYQGKISVGDLWATLELDERGRGSVFPRWSLSGAFRVVVASRRPGFGDGRFAGEISDEPQTVHIELPAENTRGGTIELDLRDFEEAGSVTVSIYVIEKRIPTVEDLQNPSDIVLWNRHSTGATDYREKSYSSPLLLAARYRISVRQGNLDDKGELFMWNQPRYGLIWQGEAEVFDGNVTHVHPTPTQSAAARVKIELDDRELDSSAYAVLKGRKEAGIPWDWDWEPGACATGASPRGLVDEDGVAYVYGLDPAQDFVVADALGYEPQVIRATLKPGEVVDLGTVRLFPGTGKVTINVERPDGVEDAEYKLMISRRGGGALMPDVVFRGNTFELTGISLDTPKNIALSLWTMKDDLITNAKYVVLDDANPTAEVTFTLRKRDTE